MALVKVTRPGFAGGVGQADAAAVPAEAGDVTIMATSDVSETPRARFAIGSMAFVIVAAVVAYALEQGKQLREPLKLAGDVNAFALIYVATQSIERLLEPVSSFLLPVDTDKENAKKSKDDISLAGSASAAMTQASDAANKAALVTRKKSERSILFWVLASLIGIVVSAAFGLQFLSILLDESSRSAIPRWFDVVATGLVIGGGTKALHGLVERISKPKDEEATA
jgi:hypothetical protein